MDLAAPHTPDGLNTDGLRFRKASKDAINTKDIATPRKTLGTPDSGLDLSVYSPSPKTTEAKAERIIIDDDDDDRHRSDEDHQEEEEDKRPPVHVLSEAFRRRDTAADTQDSPGRVSTMVGLIPYAVVLVLLASSVFAVLAFRGAAERSEEAANGKYAAIAYGARKAMEQQERVRKWNDHL